MRRPSGAASVERRGFIRRLARRSARKATPDVGGVDGPGADGLVGGAVLHVARVQTRRKCQTVTNGCRYWQEPLTGEIKTFEYTEWRSELCTSPVFKWLKVV